MNMQKIQCCFCKQTGTERSIKIHMALSHQEVMSGVKRFRWGRPPKDACELCGMEHVDIPRHGWAEFRRKLERPKGAVVFGKLRPGERTATIGRITTPNGITGIKGFLVWADAPARFTFGLPSGDVSFEYPRKVA